MGHMAYAPLVLGIIVAIGIIIYSLVESQSASYINIYRDNNMGLDDFTIETCPRGYNINIGDEITTCDNMDITQPMRSFRLYGPRDDRTCLTAGCFNSKYNNRRDKCEALEKYFKDEPGILRNWREIRNECQK